MGSSAISIPTAPNASISNELKVEDATPSVKPCCVCTEEKASRDKCMLMSNSDDAQKDCASTIDLYKSCMAGFGFKLP